jgi:hypothetical protein
MKHPRTAASAAEQEEVLPEYDFRGGVRGKHVGRFAQGSNAAVFAPDATRVFPARVAVNEALYTLVQISRGVPRKR